MNVEHVVPIRDRPVLEVVGLDVRYGRATAVRDVSFTLQPGETVALVGGSGAGKSTVAKALAGLVPPASGTATLDLADAGGPVELFNATRSAWRTARRAMHLVMQDPYASLPPHRRIADIVAEPLVIHRMGPPGERTATAAAALDAVGLDPDRYRQRFPNELSGGERQRVAFARATVTHPRVILADEPTGMLDASLRAEISELMQGLAHTEGTAILHITHDLALAAHTCDRVIVMAAGEIVEQGETRHVLSDPQHETTRRLLDAALLGARRVRGLN